MIILTIREVQLKKNRYSTDHEKLLIWIILSLIISGKVQKQPFASVLQNSYTTKFLKIHSKTAVSEPVFFYKAAGHKHLRAPILRKILGASFWESRFAKAT